MKILVVGAGWYGCHIATTLLAAGHTVWIVDKTNGFFHGSSSKNQNRLHLGYHYPRSRSTIEECKRGFTAFEHTYGFCTSPIPNNYYLIHPTDSKTSAEAFAIMAGPSEQRTILGQSCQVYPVAERFIDNTVAALYFRTRLGPHMLDIQADQTATLQQIEDQVLKKKGVRPDWIINATYNHLEPIPFDHYELFISLLYRAKSIIANETNQTTAITVMDGEFFSIFPYDISSVSHLYTLTHVKHGVLWKGRTLPFAHTAIDADIQRQRKAIESDVLDMFPTFLDQFEYAGYFTSWKTKDTTTEDDRSVRIHTNTGSHTIHVYGGKITGIFDAADAVLKAIA